MIKKFIPFKWKAWFQIWRYGLSTSSLKWNSGQKDTRRIFLFMAADYGNLGDVAITYAQHKFLQKKFPDYRVIEIPISCTLEGIAGVKKTITQDDLVTTIGGGNMGDLYPMIEHFRQLVIAYFPKNIIISFPQTADFQNTVKGRRALGKAIRVYSQHPRLVLLAREEKTFNFFQANFPKNKAFLVPDIVLSLNTDEKKLPRDGALICLRDDKEKKLTPIEEKELTKIVQNTFRNIQYRDTHIGGSRMPLLKRTKELLSIWRNFGSSEIVITDRLHGMIFSYITNTPALVFLNNNHKIKSSYEWIKHRENIKLIEDFDEPSILEWLEKVQAGEFNYTGNDLNPHYTDPLTHIKSIL